jgi:hypothetical protein
MSANKKGSDHTLAQGTACPRYCGHYADHAISKSGYSVKGPITWPIVIPEIWNPRDMDENVTIQLPTEKPIERSRVPTLHMQENTIQYIKPRHTRTSTGRAQDKHPPSLQHIMDHVVHHLTINPQGMGKGHGLDQLIHHTLGIIPILLNNWEEGESGAIRALPHDHSLLLAPGSVQV